MHQRRFDLPWGANRRAVDPRLLVLGFVPTLQTRAVKLHRRDSAG
jgi:hypothetical protein